jgi:hypothetical protein
MFLNAPLLLSPPGAGEGPGTTTPRPWGWPALRDLGACQCLSLRYVARLRDDLSLALAHAAADVVVVSSRLGNLPQGASGARVHGQRYRQLLAP